MENTYHHTQLPEGRIPALRVEPMPADTNQSGEVFGGWVMSQVDLQERRGGSQYGHALCVEPLHRDACSQQPDV